MVGSRIDLSIKVSIANQVNDPPLGSVLIHIQLLCQRAAVSKPSEQLLLPEMLLALLPDINGLMDAAVRLKDEQASVLHEFVAARDKEEIAHKHLH